MQPLAIRTAIRAATLVGVAGSAPCIKLDGRGKMMRSPNGRCSPHDQSHSAARNPGRTRFSLGFVELLTRRLRCLWLTDSRHGGVCVTHDEAKLAFLISVEPARARRPMD